MENLVFSLNATVPVFLLMVLGVFFHKINWIDDIFASKMNQFVFLVPLPVMVFRELAETQESRIVKLKIKVLKLGCRLDGIFA